MARVRAIFSFTMLLLCMSACGTGAGSGSGGSGGGSPTTPSGAELRVFVGSTAGIEVFDGAVRPPSLDFGVVAIGSASAPLTVVLSSEGTNALDLQNLRLIDPTGVSFTLDASSVTSPLAPSATTSFTLQFHPQRAGNINAVVGFAHNADNTPDRVFTLQFSGTGTSSGGNPPPPPPPPPMTPMISATVDATPVSHGDNATQPLTFADHDIAASAALTKSVRVSNTGTADFDLLSATLSGSGSSHFNLQPGQTLPLTLAPTQAITISIFFMPSSVGTHTATLELAHDIPTTQPTPYLLTFTGNGVNNSNPPPAGGPSGEVQFFVDGAPVRNYDCWEGPLFVPQATSANPDREKRVRILNLTSNTITLNDLTPSIGTSLPPNFFQSGLPQSIAPGNSYEFVLRFAGISEDRVGIQIVLANAPRAYTWLGFRIEESAGAPPDTFLEVFDVYRALDERWRDPTNVFPNPHFPTRMRAGRSFAVRYRLRQEIQPGGGNLVEQISFSGADASNFRVYLEDGVTLPFMLSANKPLVFQVISETANPAVLMASLDISMREQGSPLAINQAIGAEYVAPSSTDSLTMHIRYGNGAPLPSPLSLNSIQLESILLGLWTPSLSLEVMVNGSTDVTFTNGRQGGLLPLTYDFSALPQTVAAGSSLTIPFTFALTSAGAGGTTARMDTDLPGTPELAWTVTQVAESPGLYGGLSFHDDNAVNASVVSEAPISSNRIFNQGTPLGSSSARSATMVASNSLPISFNLGTPTVIGRSSADFSVDTSAFVQAIPANSWTSYDINFTPTSPGVKWGEISVDSGFTQQTLQYNSRFAVQGWALDPNGDFLSVHADSFRNDPISSGQSISLPARGVMDGATEPYWYVIANCGNATRTFDVPQVQGSGAAAFELDLSAFSTSVPVGGQTWIGVRFNPDNVASHSASVSLVDTGASTPAFTFDFEGEGVRVDPRGRAVAVRTWIVGELAAWSFDPAQGNNSVYQGYSYATNPTPQLFAYSPWGAMAIGIRSPHFFFPSAASLRVDFFDSWDGFYQLDDCTPQTLITPYWHWYAGRITMLTMGGLSFNRGTNVVPPDMIADWAFFWHEGQPHMLKEMRVYRLDESLGDWVELTSANTPPGLPEQTHTLVGDKLVVWGGDDNGTYVNTGNVFDLTTQTWSAMTTTGAPNAAGHALCCPIGDDRVFIWGGFSLPGNTDIFQEGGGIYDLTTDTWSALPTAGGPGQRAYGGAVFNGEEVVIAGGLHYGSDPQTYPALGYRYNPQTNAWSLPTSAPNASQPTLSRWGVPPK